jgi:hypothetical protein
MKEYKRTENLLLWGCLFALLKVMNKRNYWSFCNFKIEAWRHCLHINAKCFVSVKCFIKRWSSSLLSYLLHTYKTKWMCVDLVSSFVSPVQYERIHRHRIFTTSELHLSLSNAKAINQLFIAVVVVVLSVLFVGVVHNTIINWSLYSFFWSRPDILWFMKRLFAIHHMHYNTKN